MRLQYAVRLPHSGGQVLLAEAVVAADEDGGSYMLPLGVAWEDEISGALSSQLALTRLRRGRRIGYLTDAFAIDPLARGMAACMECSTSIDLPDGARIEFRPTSLMETISIAADAPIRRLSAEQSNSSLILDPVVVKLVRHVPARYSPGSGNDPLPSASAASPTPRPCMGKCCVSMPTARRIRWG